MRKRVLLLALTSMLMLLCIPTFAQQPQRDSTVALRDVTAELIEKVKSYDMTHEEAIEFKRKLVESEYVIEIGKISKKTKATSQEYKNYSNKKTYKVSEGISLKELISRLPGVKTDKDGKLITSQRKDTVEIINFNNHLADTEYWGLPLDVFGTDRQPVYTLDSKIRNGTAFVKIVNNSSPVRNSNHANIVIDYYQNVAYDAIGGNSEYVDLGLSVKWASRNVGAAGPEEMGDLYIRDDVDDVNLGDSWRMPTTDELNELIDNCTWTRASVNGQIGFLITSNKPGYTDRSIFLPYFFFGTSGDMGYWADSFDPSSPNRSATLWINVYEDYFNSGYCYRHWQLPVRPVCQ